MTRQARFGEGSIASVAEALDELRAERVLLVTGANSFHTSGAADAIVDALTGRTVTRFSGFDANPKLADLLQGMEVVGELRPDTVLAVGGGSVLDMAKLLAVCATHEAAPEALVVGEAAIEQPSLPLVAVPTTAGTGSEATHFAVVYVDRRKYSVAAPGMRPTWAIVDPRLTYAVPPRTTAETGLDALSQAMESLWSAKSTESSREYAHRSLTLSSRSLEAAVNEPDPAVRRSMAEAAHLAGRAIDISFTTAPHALSYALTARFGVAHGLAVALTLGAMLEYNAAVTDADVADGRGAQFVRDRLHEIVDILGCTNPSEAAAWLRSLLRSAGLPVRLRDVGVGTADLDGLANEVNAARLANNPRMLPPQAIRAVLAASL